LRLLALFALTAMLCAGQIRTLRVFSEFVRISPFGEPVGIDQGLDQPRHILSPGVARNGHASFRVVVTLDKPGPIHLDIAQNPENAVKATLYRETFERQGEEWVPDKLVPVQIPYDGVIADVRISGQNTATFWLDLWVDRSAAVDRIKVEPQLYVNDDWVIYPMEVRILEPVIPDIKPAPAAVPGPEFRPDRVVFGPLRASFCGEAEQPGANDLTARSLIRRNVVEHLALSNATDNGKLALLTATGAPSVQAWCAEPPTSPPSGPEWYLRFRDTLFRSLSTSD
jgi:hypothetical protein